MTRRGSKNIYGENDRNISRTCECTGLNLLICRNVYFHSDWKSVRLSKIRMYEKPYIVTGNIKLTGSEQAPKEKCSDRIIGTW